MAFLVSACSSNISIDDLTKVSKDVEARGHVVLEERKTAFCEENCPVYTYVFFIFEQNKELQNFVQKNLENAFVKKNAIGIGCVNDEGVYYYNDSDIGTKEETLPINISNRLLQSSKENKIDVQFRREINSSGKGAPSCYSHFRDFSIRNTH